MNSITLPAAALAFASIVASSNLIAQDHTIRRQEDARLLQRPHAEISVEPTSIARSEPKTFPSLAPRLQAEGSSGAGLDNGGTSPGQFTGPTITVASSLVVVLGLFAGLVWITRKFGARSLGHGAIPNGVLQSLGSSPIDSRTRVTLLRCGNRVLILAQTATGIQPISEVTDPDEVRALTAACLGDSKKEFASTLQSIEQEKSQAGYLGSNADAAKPRGRGRLFATA